MSTYVNFKWPQGEDLNIQLLYKEGNTASSAMAMSLVGTHSLRMDIVSTTSGAVLYSFVSASQPGSLGSGQSGQPNINIFLPRALTLPGGAIYTQISQNSSIGSFSYDIFLRNIQSDKQHRVIRGSISIEKSSTLWQ
jgi:hypothetical protein